MSLSSAIPVSLKGLTSYIKRAEDLDKDSSDPDHPLMAYYCRKWALMRGMKMPEGGTKEGKSFLMAIMSKLEKDKSTITVSEDEAKIVLENFALTVFSRADDEFQAGLSNKGTAQKFYAAQTFLEVLEQFGEVCQETKEKIRFAKFQAAEIIKAIKEGRPPPVGENPPSPLPITSNPPVALAPTPAPMSFAKPGMMTTLVPVPQQDAFASPVLQPHHQQQPQQPQQPQHFIQAGIQQIQFEPPGQDNLLQFHSTPAPPTVPPQYNNIQLSPPPSAPTYQPAGGNPSSTDNVIKDATEYLNFAISSLKHKDIPLARERLKEALRLLS